VTALQALLVADARRDRHQQQGTRWMMTTMTRRRRRRRTASRMKVEGEDTVATEEGDGKGATSGCNKYIIT
jgi:hypothetical protein